MVCCLLLCTLLLSQVQKLQSFEFQRIEVQDGLPNECVYCIAQDKHGFMWFGTKNGSCRYDGREFKTYQSIPGIRPRFQEMKLLNFFWIPAVRCGSLPQMA
ncbi:MAG: two-component regulator propeller domain-containing protein [Candidatus Poribacteria bacterium]